MAVYVDELFTWPIDLTKGEQAKRVARKNGGQWCHLWADTTEELLAFAKKIKLHPAWLQDKPGFQHFDLTPSKREIAVKHGAIETDLGKWREERGLKRRGREE